MKYICFTGEDQAGNPIFLSDILEKVWEADAREGRKRVPFSSIADGRVHTVWTNDPVGEKLFCSALLELDLDFQAVRIRPIPVEGEVITPETFGVEGQRR